MSLATNVAEIARTMRLFVEPGQLGECRIIQTSGSTSGFYFRLDQIDEAAQLAATFDRTAKGIYLVMNEIDPATLDGRGCLSILDRGLIKDANITRRRWLLIDFDPSSPARGAGDSATGEEKSAAFALREVAFEKLRGLGFGEAVCCDSGNGGHLLFRVDLPNDEAAHTLIRTFLAVLAKRLSTDQVSVDTAVHNAAESPSSTVRSLARAETDRPDRPHRVSMIQSVSDCTSYIVPRELIESVIKELTGTADDLFIAPQNGHQRDIIAGINWPEKLILPETFPVGERHDTMLKIAGAVRSFGANETAIAEILRTFNRTRCGQGKSDDELQKIARDYSAKDCNLSMKALIESDDQAKFENAERQQKLKQSLESANKRIASDDDPNEIILKLQVDLRAAWADGSADLQKNDIRGTRRGRSSHRVPGR